MSGLVAGVDGCRAGWVVVLYQFGEVPRYEAHLCSSFADVLLVASAATQIAIDIPIGLPERGGRGGRACDVAARANLGARQSSVFAVPSRAAVMEVDYGQACAVALATSEPPLKVSKQTFNLFPKIREVDTAISADLQRRVVECHPELAFWALNGERPLTEPKKVKSRPAEPGLALRRKLLEAAGFTSDFFIAARFAARDCGADDVVDAAACAWSAARIAAGRGRRFPECPMVDARGLRMEIWC